MGQKKVFLLMASCLCLLLLHGQDRSELIRLYDSLGGPNWDSSRNWTTIAHLSTWYGVVKLDFPGNVQILDLDGTIDNSPPFTPNGSGNNLRGNLPLLSFPRLERISLSDNLGIKGVLPSFTGMPSLTHLYLQNCQFSGNLDTQFDENNNLIEVSLQQNMFEGSIPASLLQKGSLTRLFLHDNKLKGQIPQVSLGLSFGILDIRENQFTFGDILPFYNLNKSKIARMLFHYRDQGTIAMPQEIIAPIGFPFSIDLGIDSGIVENTYSWYKNGKLYETISSTPVLKLATISTLDEGIYSCSITNKVLPDLTLKTSNISLKTCAPTVTRINEKLCPNESRIIQGQTYDVTEPKDTIYLRGQASNGCDAITVVELEFQRVKRMDATICAGNFRGNIVNTSGLYKFIIPRANGATCDSMDLVNLTVIDETQQYGRAQTGIDQTVCTANYTLRGNPAPANVQGKWQERGGSGLMGVIGEDTINLDLKPGLNTFEWTFSTERCPNFSKDEVNLFLESAPILINDTAEVMIGELTDTIMPLQNDNLNFIRDTTISWLNPPGPDEGIFILDQKGEKFTFFTDIPGPRVLILSYTVQSDACSTLKDTAMVLLKIVPQRNPAADPPNVITPNGDGYNDTFFIPQLVDSFEENKNNQFIVYNKWMQRVFEEPNYRNRWGGWGQNLKPLPVGWYKFYFQGGKNRPIRGEILILR